MSSGATSNCSKASYRDRRGGKKGHNQSTNSETPVLLKGVPPGGKLSHRRVYAKSLKHWQGTAPAGVSAHDVGGHCGEGRWAIEVLSSPASTASPGCDRQYPPMSVASGGSARPRCQQTGRRTGPWVVWRAQERPLLAFEWSSTQHNDPGVGSFHQGEGELPAEVLERAQA